MPCSSLDVSIPSPTAPSGVPIAGVGIPFSLKLPNISPFPNGFPEDLLDLFNNFQFLIPSGVIKPHPFPNFTKDIFDAILSMLDQFFPFLMLYKFFLPVLNLIICIIEVLCALMNPFALISAINKLFSQCIPEFLNLFPIFALIIMIISLLLLLLALIEYIIAQILKFVNDILRNINALIKAFEDSDATGVLAIAQKLGALLCVFQNLFVLLAIFNVVIEIIKDILNMAFSIPPCDNSQNGDTSGCCSTLTCPAIVQSQFTNTTGVFQYLPEVAVQTGNPNPFFNTTITARNESWQLYDPSQNIAQAFSNIYDAYDIPSSVNPKPVFFPTDANYTATTNPNQVAYTLDLRLSYNPTNWGRTGIARFIRFTNCVMLSAPTGELQLFNNSEQSQSTGVVFLAGGLGFEDDGNTPLLGYAEDGITLTDNRATLNNFIHKPEDIVLDTFNSFPNDGYTFSNATYTFKPNLQVLFNKQLVTLGCEPAVALNRGFVNTVLFGNIALQTASLNALVNGAGFPDPNAAQNCLSAALFALRSNLSTAGVAQFQATTTICLNNLQDATNNALGALVGIGFNACKSTLALSPSISFTSQPIVVTVNLNENNGIPLTQGMPVSVADALAPNIQSFITFGNITKFSYDGYQSFTAQITSDAPGSGQIMVSFDNQILCTDVLSADPTIPPSHTLQTINYQFIYAPSSTTGTGTGIGEPRYDEDDVSRDGGKGGS